MPLTLRLVFIALFAYAGYQRAGWFERRYGRTPWGLPAVVWAVFTGFSLILGCVLLAIAERQGRKAAAQRPAGPAGHPGTPFGEMPGGPPPFGAPPFGAPPFGAPQFGAPQFGAPPVAPASSGAPPFGAPQFGTLQAAPAFGPPPGPGDPARRRPALNEWQDDPSGGFFGTAT